jgi:hypothetical protein
VEILKATEVFQTQRINHWIEAVEAAEDTFPPPGAKIEISLFAPIGIRKGLSFLAGQAVCTRS